MRAYRVFMDYDASFVVDAREIEDKYGNLHPGFKYIRGDGPTVRFIRTLDSGLVNVDHIVRVVPSLEPEYEKRVKA